ncbi:MAG: TetR family transcriptional regulator [Desulfatibacillum sp.]|nr:TetR family transcriptional regulator [Desulfatibacillum sp.]
MSKLAIAIPLENTNKKGPMGFKEEQKRQRQIVSQTLMEGALQLSAEEGYASLSLRSVARKAGIAPTSFYRHFRDMDELGLALVDQAAGLFRSELANALESMDYSLPEKGVNPAKMARALENVVSPLVESFFGMVSDNQNLFMLFFQEKTGSSKALRKAITGEIQKSAQALAKRMEALRLEFSGKQDTALALARTMLNLAISGAQEMITDKDCSLQTVIQRVSRECELVLLGALVS